MSSRTDPLALAVFEQWLLRKQAGRAESFEELLAAHPELEGSLRELARVDGALQGLLSGVSRDAAPPAQAGVRVLGDFRLLHEVGRGGMGIVYEAEQLSLHRRVALKVLPAQLTLNERALERFRREAEITAGLRHPGIVDVYSVGETDGVHYLAMGLVKGSSLDKLIQRMQGESFDDVRHKPLEDVLSVQGLEEAPTPLPTPVPRTSRSGAGSTRRQGSSAASSKNYVESAVRLILQVAEALGHAHQAGVIHRDVKPSNILVRTDGTAVLTDFGLARQEGMQGISVTGEFAGTPNYVSPEQAMARRVRIDHRTDIFSLGATLYELLTLERAFGGEDSHEVLSKIISKEPRNPQKLNPILAPDLVTIVLKALEKDPDRRYASMRELADDLRAFIEYRPIRAKRTGTVVRAWRWVRREPYKAGLGAAAVLGLPLFAGMGWTMLAQQEQIELLQLERKPLIFGEGGGELSAADAADLRALREQAERRLASDPRDAKALANLAAVLYALEDYAGAVEQSRAAVEVEELPEAYDTLGTALFQLASFDQAAEALERSVKLRPDAPQVQNDLGRVLLELAGRGEEALEHMRRAVELDPDEALYRLNLGTALVRVRDDVEGGIVELRTAVELDPGMAHAWANLGTFLMMDGRLDEAIEAQEQAVRVDPKDARHRFNLANTLWRAGRHAAALETLQEAVRRDPDQVESLNLLAWILVDPDGPQELHDAARGLEYAHKAVELSGGRVAAYLDTLAWALFANDRTDEAVETEARALDALVQNPEIQDTSVRDDLEANFERLLRASHEGR